MQHDSVFSDRFKSAASAVPPRGQNASESREFRAIGDAAQEADWKRLGVLLGAHDEILGSIVARWPDLSIEQRRAICVLLGV